MFWININNNDLKGLSKKIENNYTDNVRFIISDFVNEKYVFDIIVKNFNKTNIY